MGRTLTHGPSMLLHGDSFPFPPLPSLVSSWMEDVVEVEDAYYASQQILPWEVRNHRQGAFLASALPCVIPMLQILSSPPLQEFLLPESVATVRGNRALDAVVP